MDTKMTDQEALAVLESVADAVERGTSARGDANLIRTALAHLSSRLVAGEDFEAKVERGADACDTLLHKLEGWDKAYPEDIFPELTTEEREWMQANKRGLVDRISASMGRHIARCIREDLAGIRAALDAAGVGNG